MHTTEPVDRRTAEHSTLTPSQRSQRARQAALTRWSREDSTAGTQAARTAFLDRFMDQVDPGRELPEAERMKRAERAKRAHFQALAYRRHRKS